jgi:hypothetical protein
MHLYSLLLNVTLSAAQIVTQYYSEKPNIASLNFTHFTSREMVKMKWAKIQAFLDPDSILQYVAGFLFQLPSIVGTGLILGKELCMLPKFSVYVGNNIPQHKCAKT